MHIGIPQEKLEASRKVACDVAKFINSHELHSKISVFSIVVSLYVNLLLTVRGLTIKNKPESSTNEIDKIILNSIEGFINEVISTYVLNASLDDDAKTETGVQ